MHLEVPLAPSVSFSSNSNNTQNLLLLVTCRFFWTFQILALALTLRELSGIRANSGFTGSSSEQDLAGLCRGAKPKRGSHRLWSFEIVSDRLGSVLTSATFLADTTLSGDGEQPVCSKRVSWETYHTVLMV